MAWGLRTQSQKNKENKGEKRLDAVTFVTLSRCHTNHVEAAFGWTLQLKVWWHHGSAWSVGGGKRTKSRSGRDHSPARRRWGVGGSHPGGGEGGWMGYTLLRNSPPVGCSGVLHSEEFLALSLLLLGSLSLMMSYWRQKRAITPGRAGGRSDRLRTAGGGWWLRSAVWKRWLSATHLPTWWAPPRWWWARPPSAGWSGPLPPSSLRLKEPMESSRQALGEKWIDCSSCVSITRFSRNKSDISTFLSKYNCHLQVFQEGTWNKILSWQQFAQRHQNMNKTRISQWSHILRIDHLLCLLSWLFSHCKQMRNVFKVIAALLFSFTLVWVWLQCSHMSSWVVVK